MGPGDRPGSPQGPLQVHLRRAVRKWRNYVFFSKVPFFFHLHGWFSPKVRWTRARELSCEKSAQDYTCLATYYLQRNLSERLPIPYDSGSWVKQPAPSNDKASRVFGEMVGLRPSQTSQPTGRESEFFHFVRLVGGLEQNCCLL